jgi:hypothetical protein
VLQTTHHSTALVGSFVMPYTSHLHAYRLTAEFPLRGNQ